MDRGQARIRRQQRDHAIVATTRVSASVGGISVATGSPSQADFFKTGQVDRLHQDGSGGRGRVGRRLRTVTSRQACEHRWYARAEVKQLRAIRVAAGGRDAGGG